MIQYIGVCDIILEASLPACSGPFVNRLWAYCVYCMYNLVYLHLCTGQGFLEALFFWGGGVSNPKFDDSPLPIFF